MIKLIASDMDGTLLDAKMTITKENIEAIKKANSLGIEFMVATGRSYEEAKQPLEEAGLNCAMITLNGAAIFDKSGKSTFTAKIEKKIALAILDILQEHEIYFEVSTSNGVFSESQEKRIENFASHIATTMPHLTYKVAIAMAAAHLSLLEITYVDNIRQLIEKDQLDVLKIIGFSLEGQTALKPARKQVEALKDLAVTASAKSNIEINHVLAQKGAAVAYVANSLGIKASEVLTIGDNFNDVSMLQWADISFAMGNAEEEVKKQANYTTATNTKSGVGKAILKAIEENL